ncbi:MAG: SBBP repeat-containing protein, partial [Thermosynechococcaceae cyanobacterium]
FLHIPSLFNPNLLSSGNVLISGSTEGNLGGPNKFNSNAWVAKYSPDGALLWTKKLGSNGSDYSYGVATDSIGNVLISGSTAGKIGVVDKGGDDAFVAAYSPDGQLRWKRQGRVSGHWNNYSSGVAADGSGNTFISGYSSRR